MTEPNPFWFAKRESRRRRAAKNGSVRPDIVAMLLVGLTFLCFLAAAIFPVALSYFVPRAWFVPVMLGLPLFGIAFVTAISHYIRFPVVLLSVLVLAWLATLAPQYHDARTLARAPGSPARQVKLEDALADWKRRSCTDEPGPNCGNHPIILALAGGASRASFFSATVVGSLIDMSRKRSGTRDFARQVFAISGVSGGSVGAAMIRAALEDAGPGRAPPPCNSADGLWFATAQEAGLNRFWGQTPKPDTWKGCLQALTSGDFLSPAVLGLAFRDGFAGPITFAREVFDGDDRAALLEQAFEVRYATVLAEPATAWERFRSLVARGASNGRKSLTRPFGRPHPDFWTPLLLLNATSVDTGRRVIASELKPVYGAGKRLFAEAYDMFAELRRTFKPISPVNDGVLLEEGPPAFEPDIRLSTAATLSARFPIVSPYGGLRNPAAIAIADRVVDGGYFEDDGVTTASQLAQALTDFDRELAPIIVHVTNDPVGRYDVRDEMGRVTRANQPPGRRQ